MKLVNTIMHFNKQKTKRKLKVNKMLYITRKVQYITALE